MLWETIVVVVTGRIGSTFGKESPCVEISDCGENHVLRDLGTGAHATLGFRPR